MKWIEEDAVFAVIERVTDQLINRTNALPGDVFSDQVSHVLFLPFDTLLDPDMARGLQQ